MSASRAAMIALRTKAAGPNLRKFSKADCIGKSKTGLFPVLRSHLISREARNFLSRCQPEAQSGADGARRKTSNLIQLCEILGPDRKENVAFKSSCFPSYGEPESGQA